MPERSSVSWLAALLIGTVPCGPRELCAQDETVRAREPAPVDIALNELFERCRPVPGHDLDEETIYRTMGIVRRSAALDAAGTFALVHPVGACCAAGVAIGFRVRSRGVDVPADGTWVTLRGRVRAVAESRGEPRGHLARLADGVLRLEVVLVPEQIEVYDRLKDPGLADIVDRLASPSYATFARAVRAVGWDRTLRQPTYFTVFAPTEHAFARLPDEERAALFADENTEELLALVLRHVVAGVRSKRDLIDQKSVRPLDRRVLVVEARNGVVFVGGSRVLFEDTSAKNGIVLAIDRVLPAR